MLLIIILQTCWDTFGLWSTTWVIFRLLAPCSNEAKVCKACLSVSCISSTPSTAATETVLTPGSAAKSQTAIVLNVWNCMNMKQGLLGRTEQ